MLAAADEAGIEVEGSTVIVQGFGNVGSWTARLAVEAGCKVVGVSDVDGGIYRSDGIDVEKLLAHNDEAGTVAGFPGTDAVPNEEMLELQCDFLVPAAIGGVIHMGNVSNVRARMVVEAANQPVTPQADDVLGDRGIVVLPDVLVNAGGVIVSYFEWSQNLYQAHWDEDMVNAELSKIMTRAYDRVSATAREHGITYREAAFLLGVGSVAHVARIRGFI
jgi:glutamate dehydrogenase/leucine dehydrogenase